MGSIPVAGAKKESRDARSVGSFSRFGNRTHSVSIAKQNWVRNIAEPFRRAEPCKAKQIPACMWDALNERALL